MTPSTVASDPSDDDLSLPKPTPYQYDLCLEIGVKESGTVVPVVAIFHDFIKHLKEAADEDAPVAVLTATDKLFIENKEMASDEFQKAFKVDNTEGKASKVLLGFKIHSLTKLSELKRRLMLTYLIPRNLFLRQHVGGFDEGVKSYSYGFLKDDHPDHPDISQSKQRFARNTSDAWKKLDKDDRQKWRQEFPTLFFGKTGIIIPVNFTKERISAATQGKERISTSALVVSTNSKYGKLLKVLLDVALTSKRINNLIPFALNREDAEGYYYMVAHQARFMENHRNIPLANIPMDADTKPGMKGMTLKETLNSNPAVQRVAFDPQNNKYHVSTTASKYRELHQWIARSLNENRFPFSPQIKSMKYGAGNGSTAGISYADIFKDAMSHANESYDASTIKTSRSSPWKNHPPVAISYDINDAAFPALPRTKAPAPLTPSTASETYDEDTIQSAISTAIKKLEEQHKAELEKLKLDMQSKIDEVRHQMIEMGQQVVAQTYQALAHEESPLVTKTDQAVLQQDIGIMKEQLSAMMNMFQHARIITTDTTPENLSVSTPPHTIIATTRMTTRNLKRKPTMTPEKASRSEEPLTQDQSVSSAGSCSAESMEGCES